MAAVETISNRVAYIPKSLRGRYALPSHTLGHHQPQTRSADIYWEPNYEKYLRRSVERAKLPGLPRAVPDGWPARLDSPLAWTCDTLAKEELIFALTDDQINEVFRAVEHFKGLGLHARDVTPETFPLPTLGVVMKSLGHELHYGRGFIVIRGLDNDDIDDADHVIAFLGVSSYVAPHWGRQDQWGTMIVHIRDAPDPNVPTELRESVYTNLAQPFHNDVFCEVLALQTRGLAAHGGNSIIASAWTVYNELAATRPDLIHTLAADDWTFDTFGRDPPYHQRPLLFHHDDRIIMNFSRRILTGSPSTPRTAGIPPITEAQAEALDAVHFLAEKHQVVVPMRKGDLRYVNNHAVLHCRDAFLDGGSEARRHLVRLWLRHPEMAWKMPRGLEMAMDRVYADLGEEERERQQWVLDPDESQPDPQPAPPQPMPPPVQSCGHG